MPSDTLTVIDNRTGKSYEIPITDSSIRAKDLRQIKTSEDEYGLLSYDPGFTNTASCRSKITFIDGDRGILNYRGYPIEELAEKSTYLETAYLILNGDLPNRTQLDEWVHNIKHHTLIHENIKKLIDGFHHDAHPMGMLLAIVGALSTFYPDAKNIFDPHTRREQIFRLIAKMPTIAAFCYRHSVGLPFAYPDNDLSYTGNFLNMLFKMTELKYSPHPDPYAAIAAATAALYGPLHGGANEAVLRMLGQIGCKKNVPDFIQKVKRGEGRLMGFGHRIYKSYDPRARIIKQMADQVFGVMGRNPLLDIALELERIALEDDYFISRRLYPNVDFYSGLIYQSMKIPVDMFPVMFAIPRTCGWLTQWEEMLLDSEQKIVRPRQIYVGPSRRSYIPLEERS